MPRKVFLNTRRSPQAASVSDAYLLRRSARYSMRPYSAVADFTLPRRAPNLALFYSIIEKVLCSDNNCVRPPRPNDYSDRASPREKLCNPICVSLPLECNYFPFAATTLYKLPSEAP